ncbi:MAG: TRAP transporter substrate-binding protein DctP [Myxococcota bacterium]
MAVMLLVAVPVLVGDAPVNVKMGTVAPEGSPWHRLLQETGEEWSRISGGKASLRIYAGGVLGDELDMVKKLRIGQLHAVALSGAGLEHLEPATACLQLPLMFNSYAELDAVRARIAPMLEERLAKNGYVVLNWGDAGWVHFFSKTPARLPDDVRRMKLFTNTGDPRTLELYKAAGFRPVPLAVTDMLTALQTGMIDAYDVPPLLALLNQWFALADNMIDLKWAPLIGATVITRKVWEKFPEDQRPRMLAAAQAAGDRFRERIRNMNDEAIEAMRKRGLKVHELTAQERAVWQREAEAVYPKLRDKTCPAEFFDDVLRLRNEVRAAGTAR